MFNQKKGVSGWIAWVLILAFVVSLSAFMYDFMIDYTESSTEGVKKVVYDTDECRSVSISIESACQDISSQVLNITLQNRNYIRVKKMNFRMFNPSKKPLLFNTTNTTLNPNRKKTINIPTSTDIIGYVEVIPIVIRDNLEIVCGERKATYDGVSSC